MLLLFSTASVIFRYFIAGAGFQNANKEWKPYLNCFNTSYSNSYTNCTTSISSVLVETFISNNIINYKWVFLKTQITLKVIFSNSFFKSTFKISSCGHIHFIHNIVRLTTPLSLAIPPLPDYWYNIMYSIKAKYAIVRLSFCIITPFSCGRQVVAQQARIPSSPSHVAIGFDSISKRNRLLRNHAWTGTKIFSSFAILCCCCNTVHTIQWNYPLRREHAVSKTVVRVLRRTLCSAKS